MNNIFGLVILLASFQARAAAPICSATVGTYVYDRAVTVGRTITYFSPGLRLDATTVAGFATFNVPDYMCKAFGFASGSVGAIAAPTEGAELAVQFSGDGSVLRIGTYCELSSCNNKVMSLTCRN